MTPKRLTPPRPETRVALLPRGEAIRPTPTRHVYVDTREVKLSSTIRGWGHFFRCEVTGVERVWGVE